MVCKGVGTVTSLEQIQKHFYYRKYLRHMQGVQMHISVYAPADSLEHTRSTAKRQSLKQLQE